MIRPTEAAFIVRKKGDVFALPHSAGLNGWSAARR